MKLAITLMDRFGVPEALIGDVVEKYRRRRSALWLWRQTLVAMAETSVRAVREHTMEALGAATLGVLVLWLWVESTWAVCLWASRLPLIEQWSRDSRLFLFVWHVYGMPLNVAWCLGAAAIGRVIARRRLAFVLVAVVALLPLELWWGVPMGLPLFVYKQPLAFAFGRLTATLAVLLGMPLSTLAGGLSRASRE
jgi:hypothetical protein